MVSQFPPRPRLPFARAAPAVHQVGVMPARREVPIVAQGHAACRQRDAVGSYSSKRVSTNTELTMALQPGDEAVYILKR